jgi:peptide/nickel transport system permease protein
VWQAIIRRAPATAVLAVAALTVEFVLGMLLGLLSVWRPGNWLDRILSNISMTLVALPQFWIGLLLIFVFAFRFQWFPLGGIGQPLALFVFLPALTIGLGGAAYYHQLITARMQDILHEDYIRTAYAKGAGRMRVLRHAMAVMWPTLLTQIGMDFGYFMAGVVVVETVFGWPGIGLQAWEAIQALDVPLIMGTVIFGAFWIILANFLVDILYAFVDPRIRIDSSRGQ